MWLVDSIKEFFRRGDLLLLGLCLAASGFGLIMIYSATNYMGSTANVMRQAVAIGLGVVAYIICSFVDIDLFLEKGWKLLPIFTAGLLIALFFFGYGEDTTGNKNWISLPGIPFNIQPAELTKISFIMLMAYQISKLNERNKLSAPVSVLQLMGHFALTVGAIFVISGDAGMCLAYLFIFAAMLWVGKLKLRWFAAAIAVMVPAVYFLYDKLPGYMRNRIAVVFDHSLDPLGIGYQQRRGILALASGQLTGQGYLQGTQSQSAAGLLHRHTDFIFAVIGEELGLVGCLFTVLLLCAIILRCLYVSRVARTESSGLICVGFAGMLFIQMFLNIGMVLFIMPTIGLTLPFISYGGSSIISLFASMGLVSSVKMRSLPSWLKDRQRRI